MHLTEKEQKKTVYLVSVFGVKIKYVLSIVDCLALSKFYLTQLVGPRCFNREIVSCFILAIAKSDQVARDGKVIFIGKRCFHLIAFFLKHDNDYLLFIIAV